MRVCVCVSKGERKHVRVLGGTSTRAETCVKLSAKSFGLEEGILQRQALASYLLD